MSILLKTFQKTDKINVMLESEYISDLSTLISTLIIDVYIELISVTLLKCYLKMKQIEIVMMRT